MDRVDRETRSRIMASVKSEGTKMELAVKPALEALGFQYHPRVHGSPDYAHLLGKVAVFLDGCFWHMCPFHCTMPASNRDRWLKKFERNRERDAEVTQLLTSQGWRVIRVWEHDLKDLVREYEKAQKREHG